jgi:hypothetical protein
VTTLACTAKQLLLLDFISGLLIFVTDSFATAPGSVML